MDTNIISSVIVNQEHSQHVKTEKIYNKILKYLTKYFKDNQFSHNIKIVDDIEHHSILSIKDKILIELDDDSHFKGDNYVNVLEKDINNIEEAISLGYKVIRICLLDILQKKLNLKQVLLFILNKIKQGDNFNIYYVSNNKILYRNHSLQLKKKMVSIMLY